MESALEKHARLFAYQSYEDARKIRNPAGDPCIMQCANVVRRVRAVGHTEAMVVAAWLHGIVEHTRFTREDLRPVFGDEAAELLYWIESPGDPGDGTRAERSARERAHLEKAPGDAQTIKLAELIEKARSFGDFDPLTARNYRNEMTGLLQVLKDGDLVLFTQAEAILRAFEREEGMPFGEKGVSGEVESPPPSRASFGS